MRVATHTSFRPGASDKSYIQFWNEQLTLNDINELSLQALELLILSACTAALSSHDAELGFAGLARWQAWKPLSAACGTFPTWALWH